MQALDNVCDSSVLLGSATPLPTAHWKTVWLPFLRPPLPAQAHLLQVTDPSEGREAKASPRTGGPVQRHWITSLTGRDMAPGTRDKEMKEKPTSRSRQREKIKMRFSSEQNRAVMEAPMP